MERRKLLISWQGLSQGIAILPGPAPEFRLNEGQDFDILTTEPGGNLFVPPRQPGQQNMALARL